MLLMAHGSGKVNAIGAAIVVEEIPLAGMSLTARFSSGSKKAWVIAQIESIRTTCKVVFHFLNIPAR